MINIPIKDFAVLVNALERAEDHIKEDESERALFVLSSLKNSIINTIEGVKEDDNII